MKKKQLKKRNKKQIKNSVKVKPKRNYFLEIQNFLKARLLDKYPVFGFLGIFFVLMALFYLLTNTDFYNNYISQPIVNLNAKVASLVLNIFGLETQSINESVKSADFAFDIKAGCDALEPTAIFISALLAFPLAFRFKWKGFLLGVLFLLSANFIRIISLFFVGVYSPDFFELVHVEVWQSVFILLSIFTFFFWMNWAIKQIKKPEIQLQTA